MHANHTNHLPPYLISIGHNQFPNVLVAHIENGRVIYMQELLKKTMQNYGVEIPPNERKNYEDKVIVYLSGDEDKLFERAFRNIYYTLHMSKDEYKWSDKV